jgi:hypothetical protein
VCRRGFQDLLKVRPHFLSRDDHDRKQGTDISKYSFLHRTIKLWNQLLAQALATFPCKSHVVRKRIREVRSEWFFKCGDVAPKSAGK